MSPAPSPTESHLVAAGRALPLRGSEIRVDARGGIARVILSQRFENPHAETLAVTYRMPLPADGAVSGYAFRIGGRRIVGEVDRRAAARERFEQAVVEGRRAAIVEQERSSLFTQEIHGIPPGAELVAELVVDQRLAWLDDGAWEWRFPTAAAPRYLGAPGAVLDADRVALDVADAPLEARFSLTLDIRDAVAEGGRPESPSHRIATERQRVALASGEAPLDRDVVVRWPVARPAAGVTLDLARPAEARAFPDSAYAVVTLVPPSRHAGSIRPAPVPRDLAILLDRSGSMAGEPLAHAQRLCAALVDSLGGADTIEVLAFGSTVERFRSEPVPATPGAKREALAWLVAQRAGGGTEMGAGIRAALATARPHAHRQVVVVSDGLIGSEEETVLDVLRHLPSASRLHTVGVGSAVNRSFTAAAARAGRGAEVIVGLGEDPERAVRRLVARTEAPLIVDLTVSGSALEDVAPERLPDLFAGVPALVAARVAAAGGDLVVRGRTADGTWEQRVRVPPTPPGAGSPGPATLFAREAVEDLEMHRCAGDRPDADADITRLGLDFQIATRLTSWVAVDTAPTVDPGAPLRTARVPQALPHGLSAEALGLRAPAPPPPRPGPGPDPGREALAQPVLDAVKLDAVLDQSRARAAQMRGRSGEPVAQDFNEKTRVTVVVAPAGVGPTRSRTDCLVVVYTKELLLLGKRFALEEHSLTRIGRGPEGSIVLEGDSVSRRHAHLELRREAWTLVDDGSTNGTYVNDEPVAREAALKNGDRIKIGSTIFKFLSGADVEAQYHEEIYRMTIMDGLTQIHNRRYLLEALERDITRARRHGRDLSILLFDVDHFKRINDVHGHLAGDSVLKDLARVVQTRVRRDELVARYGGEEFVVVLPETSLAGAVALAETLRQKVSDHSFVFQADAIRVTISVGAAVLGDGAETAADLIKRADERLYAAKHGGRDRVSS